MLDKYFGVRVLGGALQGGTVGVDLFFLISGFIIAIVSLDGPELTPAVRMRTFFVRRFTRIIPLMWIAILSFAAMVLVFRGVWHDWDYVRAMFLLPWNPLQPAHIWTLRQELVFYLLFAATMLGRRRWRLLLVAWAIVPLLLNSHVPYEVDSIQNPLFVVFSPCNLEFCSGLVLAIVWLKWSHALRIRLPFDSLLALVALAILSIWGAVPLLGAERGWVTALLLMPLVFLGIHLECPAGLGRKVGETLGNASYSIYLFHPPIISAVLSIWARLLPRTPPGLAIAGCTIICACAGVALHFMVERPLIATTRYWLRGATAQAASRDCKGRRRL